MGLFDLPVSLAESKHRPGPLAGISGLGAICLLARVVIDWTPLTGSDSRQTRFS